MNTNHITKKGIYRHFKGGEYELLEIATDSETLEPMVVYKSTNDGKVWVRPLEMFNENVDINGKSVNRFQYIRKL